MHLDEALGDIAVLDWRGDRAVVVSGVSFDSARTVPGDLFACVPGATSDGHDHAAAAVVSGAAALLVERFVDVPAPQARVASVRAALGGVAAAVWGHPSKRLAVCGVTGTNGKTTTTWLLEAIVGASGAKAGVIGTIGARIAGVALDPPPGAPGHTTPEAPDLQALLARMVDAGVGLVAMEVSSHALSYRRVDGTHFAAAGFTNLSHDHLDFHRDTDAYFEAKAQLFDPARARSAVVNLDDPFGRTLAERCSARMGLLGTSTEGATGAEVRAQSLETTADGNRFRLVTPYGSAAVASPLVGRFNAANALTAAGLALSAGVAFDAVATGLSAALVVPGRMERVDAGQPFAVIVDYAHTPDGLEKVLTAGRGLVAPGGRLTVVFGCGGDRDRAKRPVMGATAARLADAVWVTSDNPRSEDPAAIAAAAAAGAPGATVVLDRREAIAAALAAAGPADVVVVAGKGHETGQTTAGVTVAFDDRQVAAAELGALGYAAGPACA